jgi:hypothetical protein
MGVSQRHALAGLYFREKTPCTHWTGGWVGLRAGLDTDEEKYVASARDRTMVVQFSFRNYTN